MTKQDQTEGSPRFAPRPVSRPPVDPSTTRAFGRPDGVNGSFVTEGKLRDQGEFTPTNQSPDPVLHEAFGRPNGRKSTLMASAITAPFAEKPLPAGHIHEFARAARQLCRESAQVGRFLRRGALAQVAAAG